MTTIATSLSCVTPTRGAAHAKVSIVDDEWFSVGSANLNRRGLATDTEMNVQVMSAEIARQLRCRLWAEHLGVSEEDIRERDPIDLIDQEWREVAERMASAMRTGSPPEKGQVVRYEVKRGVEGRLLDLAQSLSLEH